MATVLDVTRVIASALAEVGVNGRLDVSMGATSTGTNVGMLTGDDYEVTVTVPPLPEADRNEDG